MKIVIVPRCYIHDITLSGILKNDLIKCFVVYRDTPIYSNEVFVDKKVYTIPRNRMLGGGYFSGLTTQREFIENDVQLSMVKLAESLSKDFFFVEALPGYPEGCIPVAFLTHGSVSFIDRELNIYATLEDIILKYYGSVAKYLEIIKEDSVRFISALKFSTVQSCKLLLLNSYSFYQKHCPKDTATILNLFINEVDSLTSLTIYQKTFLFNKLHELIFTSTPGECKLVQCLLGHDPLYVLEQVLTDQQYFGYLKGRKRLIWLQKYARLGIWDYLLIEKKIPANKLDQAYEAFIFGK